MAAEGTTKTPAEYVSHHLKHWTSNSDGAFLWNCMDLLPVDLIPGITHAAGLHAIRTVPSADMSATFALSLSVFVLIIVYSLRGKGPGGYAREWLFHPFGPWLLPFNLILNTVELLAKPLSLALRLVVGTGVERIRVCESQRLLHRVPLLIKEVFAAILDAFKSRSGIDCIA